MTTEQDRRPYREVGLRARVYEALPAGARPTNTAAQPIHRHTLDKAQGDVVELTRQRISEEFGDEKHVVITLRDGDLDPAADGEVWGLLERTEGGALVFGVSYALEADIPSAAGATSAVSPDESCPECDSSEAFEVRRADAPGAHGRIDILVECRGCGAVWDSYLPA